MAGFTVVLHEEIDGGYTVAVPALEGCRTRGESVEGALAMAAASMAGNHAVRVARGMDVPPEDPRIIVASVDVLVPARAVGS